MKSDKELERELLEELMNIQLDEMSNLTKRRTGLPMNISVQIETDEQKKYKHNLPRLKFQNNKSDRVTGISDLIPISISDNPKVLIDKKYENELYKAAREWIILNKDVLLQFWNQEIDIAELLLLLKQVNQDDQQ